MLILLTFQLSNYFNGHRFSNETFMALLIVDFYVERINLIFN